MSEHHPETSEVGAAHTEHKYRVISNETEKEDLQFGERYWARVDNVVDYGVFVSLNRHKRFDERVDGLVHKNNLPALHVPTDFAEGDSVGVMLVDIRPNNDLQFEIVASLETLRNLEIDCGPVNAPTGLAAAQANGESGTIAATANGLEVTADETPTEARTRAHEEGAAKRAGEEALADDDDTGTDDADESEQGGAERDDAVAAEVRAIADSLTRYRVAQAEQAHDIDRRLEALGDTVEAAVANAGDTAAPTTPTREEAISALTEGMDPGWSMFLRAALDAAEAYPNVGDTSIALDSDTARLAIEGDAE